MLVFQIALNAIYIAFVAALIVYYRIGRKDFGEERIDALNETGFAAFSLVAGIVLMKLLVDETLPPGLILAAGVITGFIKWPIDHFYRKRNPTPDQLEPENRYLPNTTAQAYLEEAEMLSKEQDQPQPIPKKYN